MGCLTLVALAAITLGHLIILAKHPEVEHWLIGLGEMVLLGIAAWRLFKHDDEDPHA